MDIDKDVSSMLWDEWKTNPINIMEVDKDTEDIIRQFYDSGCKDYQLVIDQLKKTTELCRNYDKIIDTALDGFYVTDSNATTLKVNKGYELITGFTEEWLKGKNLRELVHEGYLNNSGALLVIKHRIPVTFDQRTSTGKKMLVTTSPMFDNDGNIVFIVSNVRDITELERLKEDLLKSKELADKDKIEIENIRKQLFEASQLIAKDKNMLNTLQIANKVASVDTTVLLLGETGVGKEELVKYIYKNSPRKSHRIIKVNCGAIPENLIESELFGYEKGAFTGANKIGKMGLFEVADKGTIFLDEISELPLNMQVKLLRVLQEMEIERVGSTSPIKIDVRVIAGTNRDLKALADKGLFRKDLFYRLNVVPINIPPLRERKDDIIPLASHFLSELNKKYSLNKQFSLSAYNALLEYNWPGNIRELKNIVERAVVLNNSELILATDLPTEFTKPQLDALKRINLNEEIERIEFDYINKSYVIHNNVRDAAKYLGMSMPTYVRKRKIYNEKFSVKKS